MRSIRKSLFLAFMLFMLILVAGNVIINVSLFKEYYMHQSKKRMKSTSEEIAKEYQTDKASLQDYIEMIDGTWGIWVRIADKDSNLLYTSKPERSKSTTLSEWAVNAINAGQKAMETDGVYYSERSNDENNIIRLVCVTKLLDGDEEVYIILTRSIQSVYENITTANKLVEGTALILIVLGSVFIFYFSRGVTKPILEINEHAKKIARLNFDEKLEIKSKNELGTLANTINEISDKLNVSIEGLKQDIDDRKELVRDMSHELKTPIAAVKGYAEGLKFAVAETPEKMEKYCNVIIEECNKMNYLVKEMLELSVMEEVGREINKTVFQAKQLIDSIEMCFTEQIRKRGLRFQIEGDENLLISGDYHLVERAAFNYMENAIRHTEDEGTIKVSFENDEEGFWFRVYNSGKHIPEGEIENIWKVFYKMEKSRVRESNNYGVGLTIVKANISLHEGSVHVENKNGGVEFSFWIPR
ncbi:sensor histidine kinase [Konateibacter massiliensis]|uniref:sensor histidine kinase n=1 Tax=Konateibacter massiliensis TaxID=2002841 RepID=UPI00117B3EB4|nr:HAMP domain-containing sensor histidine kinase [Konateibacter massiliensis]